ncbi:DNA primase [Candidatus Acetothermia bacterium]|nr:DNA primase [Candidatus Acetothermia bacterium]MBI3643786.1 DNA primase [Candidatus Acetothermia bacterium]
MANREEKEEIRARADIVEIISRYVTVHPRGKNYLAICPFHSEKTPSFSIDPEKGLFHCFGCDEGGDVFQFLMKIEKLEFVDVLQRLANEVGVTLSSEGQNAGESVKLREVAKSLAKFYQAALAEPGGEKALQYLQGRGLTPETIRRFQLGYAPTSGDHLLKKFSKSQDELSKLGLLQENESGKWSFLRGRVIYPLFSVQGEVIGFAGRILDQGEPKYLNTKGTSLFEKGRMLYGLHLAREASQQAGHALLVEGYMDVIMAHQHGFSNAVASMGTTFTSDQARLLKRFVPRVRIAYDRDNAGQAATLRGMRQLLSAGLEVEVVLLPKGDDPDSLLRKEGADAFRQILSRSMTFSDFYIQQLFEDHTTNTLSGKEAMLAETREFLAELSSPVMRSQILKELSGGLMIPLEDLQLIMKGKMRAPDPSAIIGNNASEKLDWEVEEHLMYLLLQGEISIDQVRNELTPSDFQRFSYAAEILFSLSSEQGITHIEGVAGQRFLNEWLSSLSVEDQRDLRKLAVSENRYQDSGIALAQLIGRHHLMKLEERSHKVLQQIKEAGPQANQEALVKLQQEYQECIKERKRLLLELGWGTSNVMGGGRTS